MTANMDHEVVKSFQPPDRNMKIWRYMDLTKLIDLLETGSLYFARADTLDDPYEGSLTRCNVKIREQQIQALAATHTINVKQWRESLKLMTSWGRKTVYINCWHGGETESAAMWKLYGTAAGSMVIQSTYKKLVAAFSDDVFVGMVQYKNYNSLEDWFPPDNGLSPFLHKRREFEHEKEVRAFIWSAAGNSQHRLKNGDDQPQGLREDIDIDKVVETIRVQPTTPVWAREAIEKLLDRYNLGMTFMPSEIDIEPMY